jgi:hypothetical protein
MKKLHETPGIHVLDWNENRQREGVASCIFPLGRSDEPSSPCWEQFSYEYGRILPPHSHSGWTCTVVIEGSWFADGIEYGPGQMIVAEPHTHYGPFEPGVNGVRAIEFFENLAAVAPIWDTTDPVVLAHIERRGGTESLRHPVVATIK